MEGWEDSRLGDCYPMVGWLDRGMFLLKSSLITLCYFPVVSSLFSYNYLQIQTVGTL